MSELMADLDLPPSMEAAAAAWAGHGRELPRALRAALEDLAGLADPLVSGGLSDGGSERDLADPERVIEAASALGRRRWPVWELAGRAAGASSRGAAHLEAGLAALIRPALEGHRHEDVRVVVRPQGAEVVIHACSSGPPLRGQNGEVRLLVRDLLVYDVRRGRLRLAVEHPARRALFQSAMGALLFDDPGWFSAPAVTLAPFLASSEAVLRPTRGVGRAQVAGVELGGDAPEDTLTLSGGRVLERLRALDLGDQLDQLRALTLDLQLDTREARVEVRPPHLIVYDRPREEPAVRAFLVERGLLGGPRAT